MRVGAHFAGVFANKRVRRKHAECILNLVAIPQPRLSPEGCYILIAGGTAAAAPRKYDARKPPQPVRLLRLTATDFRMHPKHVPRWCIQDPDLKNALYDFYQPVSWPFCAFSLFPIAAHAWDGGWLDELAPVYPDSKADGAQTKFAVDVPRRSIAGAHLLISGVPEKTKITIGIPKDCRLFQLRAVPVEENTGIKSRTERFGGGINPYVIRRAPFRIFEALEPCDGKITAGADAIALRVETDVPADAKIETLDLPVTVSDGAVTKTFTLTVNIHAAIVPPIGKDSFGFTNWFSLKPMAKTHKVELWTEPFWEVLDRYAALMARGRQNTFILSLHDFFTKQADGTWKLERERLRRYVKIFEKHGLWFIEGGHLAGRTGGDWGSATMDFTIGGGHTNSPEAAARLDQLLLPLAEEITTNGWADRWLQHIADECTDIMVPAYKAFVVETRKRLPSGVRIFDATMTQSLDGSIDDWCPQVQEYQAHQKFFDDQLAQHHHVWVYTCLIPGGKFLSRLLDQERLRPVYLGWSLEKYQLDGFLHWGGNYWSDDPFNKSIRPNEPTPHTNNYLPAGDSNVWYPGVDGPLSTTRFEAHRIGLEDAELLRKLRQTNPKLHNQLMQDNLRAYNDYNTDIAIYRKARATILRALDLP